jgi:hypothetical protein
MMVNSVAVMFGSVNAGIREQRTSGSAAEPALGEGAQEELFSLLVTMQKAIAASANHVYSVPVAASTIQLCMELQALDSPLLLLLQARSMALLGRMLLQLHVKSVAQLQQQLLQQQQQQQPTAFIMTSTGLRMALWAAMRVLLSSVN